MRVHVEEPVPRDYIGGRVADEQGLAVVAIGRNEGERLRRCFDSVPVGVPIFYVDSGSTDQSVNLARARGAEVVQLEPGTQFTAARARNEGLRRLVESCPGTTYVQFVDGDCEIERGWLESGVRFLDAHPQVAAVCGRRRERFREASIYNRMCDEEWDTPVGQADACGGDALMRVSALRDVAGYDPTLIAGEEPELCSRLSAEGWSIWRLDAPMTIHDAAMHRFDQWWSRAVRSGYGYAQVWSKTRQASRPGLYARELARAFGWTVGVVAISFCLALFFGPLWLLFAPVVWALQFARLSLRNGTIKAAHLLVGKAAECVGALRFFTKAALGRQHKAIFYK